MDVTTTDGEKRRFQDGDVLLVEDTTGATLLSQGGGGGKYAQHVGLLCAERRL